MKINLVVERQWHIAPHVAAMEEAGWDYTLFGGFPPSRYASLGIPASRIKSFSLPALWNFAAGRLKLPKALQVDAPKLLARWVAGQVKAPSLVVSYSTVYQHLFPLIARRISAGSQTAPILVIERGSTHPEAYFHAIQRGKREAGFSWSSQLPRDIEAEVEAGTLAHFVVAGSDMIAESYRVRGVPRERILTIPYGTDAELFDYRARTESTDPTIHIACVGYIGVRKGIGRLIRIAEWAERRGIPIRIHLVGPLEAETPVLLAGRSLPMEVHGVKKGRDLVALLHSCDLYCLPSYEEGFGISVIEAMATGLPAVVSEETGAREAITPGLDGVILPDYRDEDLDALLRPILQNRELRLRMGIAAREKVVNGYTNAHYARCLRSEYERMFSIIEAAPAGLPNISEMIEKN